MVEYQFYRTFPADKRAIVMQAMEDITNLFNSCIRFQPKKDLTVDYVNIYYGADCHRKVGRIGGKQTLNLNRNQRAPDLTWNISEPALTLA